MAGESHKSSDQQRRQDAVAAATSGALSAEQMASEALQSASNAAKSISDAAEVASARPLHLPDLDPVADEAVSSASLSLLDDVTLRVKIELGRTQMYVEDVLRLNTSSVVELDKAAGDPVDIYVNDRHVARGEVLVLNENFCVRVSEIIQQIGTHEPE